MSDIEFISDEPPDGVDVEPRSLLSRVVMLLGVGVLALVVVQFVLHNGGGSAPRPTAATQSASPVSPAPSRSPMSSSSPVLPDSRYVTVTDPGQLPVLDVAVAGSRWTLRPVQVEEVSPTGRRTRSAVPAPALIDETGNTSARLVLDLPADRLWVTVAAQLGGTDGRVLEYQASSLRLLHDIRSTPPFTASAALDGHLFLTAEHELVDIRPNGSLRTIMHTTQPLGAVVADPSRRRIIVADIGGPTQVWAVTPGSPLRIAESARGGVAGGKATLAVAGGRIWLAGYGDGRAELARLDPTTLTPILHSPSEIDFAPGAIAEAGGSSVFWVRDGDFDTLRCMDAVTGRQLQTWDLAGAVSSTAGHAVVATDGGPVTLVLGACRG